MARSKLNPEQLSKLDINNKALAKAIDLSGSTKYAIGTGLVGSEYFLVQAAGGGAEARAVSASAMQDYFNKLDVTASSANATMKLLFVENSAGASSLDDVTAAMDNNSLTLCCIPNHQRIVEYYEGGKRSNVYTHQNCPKYY